MSGWGSWLVGGGGAAKKKEAPKNAILQLRSTLEMLTKREKYLQIQIDEQDALARKYISTNKTGQSLRTSPGFAIVHASVADADKSTGLR